jgi:hypothetical protein
MYRSMRKLILGVIALLLFSNNIALKPVLAQSAIRVTAVAANQYLNQYAVGFQDGSVEIRSHDNVLLHTWQFGNNIRALEWSPIASSTQLAVGVDGRFALDGRLSSVKIINAETGAILRDLLTGIQATSISWSPSGLRLSVAYITASGSGGANIIGVFDAITGQETQIRTGFDEIISELDWHPQNEQQIAAGSLDGEVKIFDVFTQSAIASLPIPDQATSVQWNPSGTLLAATSDIGQIRIWDSQSFQLQSDLESFSRIEEMIWSSDGNLLVVNSFGQISFWNWVSSTIVGDTGITYTDVDDIDQGLNGNILIANNSQGNGQTANVVLPVYSTPTLLTATFTLTPSPTPTPTATPSPTPTPTDTPTPTLTPDPAAPVILTSGSFRALQNPGDRRVYIERAMSAGIDPFDSPPSDGWTLIGRTNGAGDNGTLRAFTVINGVPYAAVQHATKGCIVITPSSLAARTQGQTRLVRIVAQQTAYCGGDWAGFAGG